MRVAPLWWSDGHQLDVRIHLGTSMRVVITGATGMIGRELVSALSERGDTVVALSRDRGRGIQALGDGVEVMAWSDPLVAPPPANALSGADAVVHLLGEPVAQRWSADAKRRIRDSRVGSTQMLVEGLSSLPAGERPRVLVSQSATGFYGPRDDQAIDEESGPGNDFLAGVVVEWERAATAAGELTRVVRTRTGVVLSSSGGALKKMLPAFRLGIGGPVAGGRQYVPWIHHADVVQALIKCAEDERAQGPVNLTAPEPVTNAELSRALGRTLGRPAFLPVPGFAVGLLFGEMAQVVTTGQRALPRRLQELGFEFRHPDLEPALHDVLSRN
jgi:uncharacterized protein